VAPPAQRIGGRDERGDDMLSPAGLWAEWAPALGAAAAQVLASPTQLLAHLAAAAGIALAVAGALSRTMRPLRWLAVGSNLGLVVYGALRPSPITLCLSVALLPVNLYRAIEVTRLARRVGRAGVGAEMASLWLRPHMAARRLPAGQALFARGDGADRLYLLADGVLELDGIGVRIEPGRIFGEIALFSRQHTRTQTVRCVTDCTVLEIHEDTVRQLFFQNPAFAFHLMELLAQRLGSDVERAQGAPRAIAPAPVPAPAPAPAPAQPVTDPAAAPRTAPSRPERP